MQLNVQTILLKHQARNQPSLQKRLQFQKRWYQIAEACNWSVIIEKLELMMLFTFAYGTNIACSVDVDVQCLVFYYE